MLCMLGAARRATEGVALVREAGWRDWSPAFMVGGQVTGKRFGIIGMGRVGQVAAKRARGFDMAVHYTTRRRLDAAAEAPRGATHPPPPQALARKSAGWGTRSDVRVRPVG